jgi:hypothetical protein
MRQAVLKASAYLLRNHIVTLLLILFCAATAIALWQLSRLSSQLIQSSALQAASQQSDSLRELRKLYTSVVADRVVGHGISVTLTMQQRRCNSTPSHQYGAQQAD